MTTSFDRATTVDHAALIAGRINLLDARLGAKALSCSDDFFAPVERLLNPHEPEMARRSLR